MKPVLFGLAALSLVACSSAQTPRPTFPPLNQDTCDGGQYADLLGQDATALERILIMRPVRIIRPGDAITMDFRSNRINFEIGADNRVTRVFCG